jgi:rod shape determining protein RodA
LRERKRLFGRVDWFTVLLFLLLVMLGWINIYAAVYDENHSSILDITQRYGKQLIWISAAVFLGLIILLIDAKFFPAFSYFFYALTRLSLLAVLVIGTEIAGSRSWFQIGSVAIQPAEFAKFATCLALARYLSNHNVSMHSIKHVFLSLIIMLAPAALILLQNDTGSALVYAALVLVLYREGLPGGILIIGVSVAILFIFTLLINKFILIGICVALAVLIYLMNRKLRKRIILFVGAIILASGFILSVDYAFENALEPHQKKRINVLLGKEIDLRGAGYNVHQSKIAIGSGGLTGKGFLQGTQTKYNFVPEQSTDFIFCTVGEEWGFLGSFTVVALFMILLIRLVILAERQRSRFSRIYGYGVISILFFHFMVNIGMTIGLAPVIGIPLPFFSYGGSSLWAFTILLFIFLKQDAERLEIL